MATRWAGDGRSCCHPLAIMVSMVNGCCYAAWGGESRPRLVLSWEVVMFPLGFSILSCNNRTGLVVSKKACLGPWRLIWRLGNNGHVLGSGRV